MRNGKELKNFAESGAKKFIEKQYRRQFRFGRQKQ